MSKNFNMIVGAIEIIFFDIFMAIDASFNSYQYTNMMAAQGKTLFLYTLPLWGGLLIIFISALDLNDN